MSQRLRSRTGCSQCKRSKKKCNEVRPVCERCGIRGLPCQYQGREPAVLNGHVSTVRNTIADAPSHSHNDTHSSPTQNLPVPASTDITDPSPERTMLTSSHNTLARSQAFKNLDYLVESHDDLNEFRKCCSQLSGVSDETIEPAESTFPISAFDDVFTAHLDSGQHPYDFDVLGIEQNSPATTVYSHTSRSTFPRLADASHLPPSPRAHRSRQWKRFFNHFRHDFCHAIVYNEKRPTLFDLHFASLAYFEPLLDAILAVGAAHLGAIADENSTDSKLLRNESVELHSKALRGLQNSIRGVGTVSDEPRNAVVACTFCLIFYEMVVAGAPTVTTQHLIGALHLLKTDQRAGLNKTSMFHHNLFRYFDVINALTSGRAPLTGSLTYDDCFAEAQEDQMNKWHTDPYGCVDDVFGLARDLWPLLHRLAQLSEASRTFTRSWSDASPQSMTGTSNTSNEIHGYSLNEKQRNASRATLELAIRHWKPQLLLHAINMEHTPSDLRLRALIHCAEAYRHCALIHLFTVVCDDSPDSHRVQLTSKATLQACLKVITFGPPFRGLLWPTIVAGSQVITSADREVVLTILRQMYNIQGMTQISRIESLLEDWWSIYDTGEQSGSKWLENMGVAAWPVPLA